jgi:hypothetical protein
MRKQMRKYYTWNADKCWRYEIKAKPDASLMLFKFKNSHSFFYNTLYQAVELYNYTYVK